MQASSWFGSRRAPIAIGFAAVALLVAFAFGQQWLAARELISLASVLPVAGMMVMCAKGICHRPAEPSAKRVDGRDAPSATAIDQQGHGAKAASWAITG